MDYVAWEENYGKQRVTKKVLMQKQVRINDFVRQLKRTMREHDFNAEKIKEVTDDYKNKVIQKTGHINFLTAEFEQILVEHHKEFKGILSNMLLIRIPRWFNKRRVKKDEA